MAVAFIGTAIGGGGAASATIATHASTAAGHKLVFACNSGGGTVTSITGGTGGTWVQVAAATPAGALTHLSVWVRDEVAAAGDLGVNFTINYNVGTQFRNVMASFSGTGVAALLAGTTSSASAGAAITSPVYDMAAGGLAFAIGGGDSFAGVPTCTVTGAGWTERTDNAVSALISCATATGTTTGAGVAGATFTWTASHAQRAAATVVLYEAVPSTVSLLTAFP